VLHRLDRRFGRAVRGDQHDRRLGAQVAHPFEQLESAHSGHADVADDQVVLVVLQRQHRLGRGAAGHGLVARALQQDSQEVLHAGLIIDHENPGHGTLHRSCRPAA
jgi:hypothetical protein